jgi:hypothetical protein
MTGPSPVGVTAVGSVASVGTLVAGKGSSVGGTSRVATDAVDAGTGVSVDFEVNPDRNEQLKPTKLIESTNTMMTNLCPLLERFIINTSSNSY